MHHPSLILAQVSVLFSDEDFIEVFIWGVAFLFVIVMLFILNRVLRDQLGNYVRGQRTPFAVTPSDLDKMKEEGLLSEEEAKAIRQAIARKVVERAEQEAQAREAKTQGKLGQSGPTLEKSMRAKAMRTLAEMDAAKEREAPPAAETAQPAALPADVPASKAPPALPAKLAPMANLNDLELEQMVQAGFIDEAEAEMVRAARGGEA